MRKFAIVLTVLVGAVAFLIGIIAAGSWQISRMTVPERPVVTALPPANSVSPAAIAIPPAPSPIVSFADVADRTNAAVVNIDSASVGRSGKRPGRSDSDDWMDRQDEGDSRQGAGSGFIIDREGFILTNHHLVDGAERIVVTLSDGRTFRATLVGSDPAIDVALIKIPASATLPMATLGDSNSLRVGEWVCAIGNPLGYVHSVTVGVVSFIGRKLFDRSLDDYIQTDAAINFGNSGGPLINSRGEVVGINSAISSRANNIGFAVPINQARAIIPQLKGRGRVSRGYIGVMLTDVTAELQRSLRLSVSRGAMVQDLAPNSPGERAGIRPYDVITAVDSRDIWSNEELIREISARQPGTAARLHVVRDGHARDVVVKLAERPVNGQDEEESSPTRYVDAGRDDRARTPEQRVGFFVRDLDLPFLRRLEMPGGLRGVVITRIDPAGPGFGTDLRPGDIMAVYVYDPALRQRSLVTVALDAP
jgi:serine protease Do